MSRAGAVTFKGNPLTLAGNEVKAGQQAPEFKLHYFDSAKGMQAITLADVKGKPTILSVVPSLDTPVCQVQTKKFNEEIGKLGDKVNALTISLDLPFAQKRFCASEGLDNVVNLSMLRGREFLKDYGVAIAEGPLVGLAARAVVVLDEHDKVLHSELVAEIADEPDYEAAIVALGGRAPETSNL